ncbi:MAG: hypothetical protein JWM37_623 [Candidatus Saccharibacteria bacterium]|nr:hypothetical protein [Candidatus Saccharibacteria bacterium]
MFMSRPIAKGLFKLGHVLYVMIATTFLVAGIVIGLQSMQLIDFRFMPARFTLGHAAFLVAVGFGLGLLDGISRLRGTMLLVYMALIDIRQNTQPRLNRVVMMRRIQALAQSQR